jgi:hypothetical protein
MNTATKVCRLCNTSFPVTSEFWYKHPQMKDGFHSQCKECTKKRATSYHAAKIDNTPVGRPNENVFIDYLLNHGIAAEMGAIFKSFKYADVVSWGCVTIELKYSKPQDGKYKFEFTPRQRRLNCEGLNIICLAVDNGKQIGYHFFDAKNPLFYQDGKLKNSVYYNPNPQRRTRPVVLTDDMMAMAKNNFALIEQKRLAYSQQLISIAKAA